MQNIPLKKGLITESIKYPLIFFLFILSIFFIYTLFHPIPTPATETVGIGAEKLALGDRHFYYQEHSDDYGYDWLESGVIKGSFLYPSILNSIEFIISKLGLPSVAWNIVVIFLSSMCAIGSLFLIDKSANILFDRRTAKIASWIFVLSPYTIYYSINGGITFYVALGVAFFTYLLSKSNVFFSSKIGLKIPFTMLFILLNTLFLSSLRPTGSLFSIVIIFGFGLSAYFKSKKNLIKLSKIDKIIIYVVSSICLAYIFFQLKINTNYLSFTFKNFVSEGGSFFGIERELIRNKIDLLITQDFNYLKSYFYLILWKLVDFVGGISDIRDSHATYGVESLFPAMSRISVGLFIIYPINLLAFLGIFIYWKKIFYSGLWISLVAALTCLAPSLLGVAMSRYLFMVYPPILILAAKTIGIIIDEFKNQTKLKIS